MSAILVATQIGCRVFGDNEEKSLDLAGRQVLALAPDANGGCVAVVDGQGIWRRNASGEWSRVAESGISLQSILTFGEDIYAGGMDEAAVIRISANGHAERLPGFDETPGRSTWVAHGPPLGVRSLAATSDGAVLLAAVHVGGIPRSIDGGETWTPTIPINFDVHEVRAHETLPNYVAAAASVGLCESHDQGQIWDVLSDGIEGTTSLAVAVLTDETLFSIQDSPFAKRSQLWRRRIGGDGIEQVRDGLPEWLDGKIDTAQIAATGNTAAVVDGGGNLWVSKSDSSSWTQIADGLGYAFGVAIV